GVRDGCRRWRLRENSTGEIAGEFEGLKIIEHGQAQSGGVVDATWVRPEDLAPLLGEKFRRHARIKFERGGGEAPEWLARGHEEGAGGIFAILHLAAKAIFTGGAKTLFRGEHFNFLHVEQVEETAEARGVGGRQDGPGARGEGGVGTDGPTALGKKIGENFLPAVRE